MDSAEGRSEQSIQCSQGLQRRKPEVNREDTQNNTNNIGFITAKNISDQKKKSILQEQHSRQGSVEQKKTAKNPVTNRERKEDKQQVMQQQLQATKNELNKVQSTRSMMSPLHIQRTSSAKGFLTCRQQGSLYNNFIESTTKHNLTTQQQLQSQHTSKMVKQQSQSSLNHQKKSKHTQQSMLGSSKQDPSKSTIDSGSGSILMSAQRNNPPASYGKNTFNSKNNNEQDLSSVMQNMNMSSVLQNANISEIIGVDNSSSQRSMIQRQQSISSLIKPNSSISSSSVSGAAYPKGAVFNESCIETDDGQGLQAHRKSTRQKSQLDLLILANPRKTEPLIRPHCSYASQQQANMFKQYASPIRETIKDATKEAALKQQEKLRKWKQLQKPGADSELESSLFCTKEEQEHGEEAERDRKQQVALREATKHAQMQSSKSNCSVLHQDKNQSKIDQNVQNQIDLGQSFDKYKPNISRSNINGADSQKENRQTYNDMNVNITNSETHLKGCSDPSNVRKDASNKKANSLSNSKDSAKKHNNAPANSAHADSLQGVSLVVGREQQDLSIPEDTDGNTVEMQQHGSSQIQNLRESLKISIAAVNNNSHWRSETHGGSSLSPDISCGLFQIQEKDSQQNTQRQRIPEQHFLTNVDWRGINIVKEEFFGQTKDENIKCPIHSESLSLYCEKDKRLLCVSCLFDSDEHQKHTVLPLKAATGIMLSNASLFKAQLKEKVNSFDEGFKKCLVNREQLERSFEKNLDMLNKEFQALKNAINVQQKALEQQIISTYEASLFKYDALIADIKEIQACMVESQKNAIALTAASSLDSIAREHFIFNTLFITLQHAHFTVLDIKKTDLDIFTVKMKQEMKNCLQEYANVKNLQDRHIGIKIHESTSVLAGNIAHSRINSPPQQQDKSYCQTARTHYASSKSSARDTTNSISPARYDYVQRTLQAHYGASSKNLANSQEMSSQQQRSKSRLKSTTTTHGGKQLLASSVKQSLDSFYAARGNSQTTGVNEAMNVSSNNYATISKSINSQQPNNSSNNNNNNTKQNLILTQPMDNTINLSHYAIDNHLSKRQNSNIPANSQRNNSSATPQPEQIRNKYHANNHEIMQNSNQQSLSAQAAAAAAVLLQQQQQQRQSTLTSTVMSLQSKRFRELPKYASTSIN